MIRSKPIGKHGHKFVDLSLVRRARVEGHLLQRRKTNFLLTSFTDTFFLMLLKIGNTLYKCIDQV